MEYRELSLNIMKEFSNILSILMNNIDILNNLRRNLTVFPSDFNNIYLKYFGILQNLMRNYEITKVDESYDIFSVKSLSFIPFRLITMYFLHFVISYSDK